MKPKPMIQPANAKAWAVGKISQGGRFHVRRIFWGRILAREERRDGETIRRALILIGRMPA